MYFPGRDAQQERERNSQPGPGTEEQAGTQPRGDRVWPQGTLTLSRVCARLALSGNREAHSHELPGTSG